MYSVIDIPLLGGMGFPIQRSPAQCLFNGSPKLIAADHVFHRHPAPRHPPFALSSLAINFFIYAITMYLALSKLIYPYSVFKERIKIGDFDFNNSFSFAHDYISLANEKELLVEVNGIEPMTSCVQSRCSPN